MQALLSSDAAWSHAGHSSRQAFTKEILGSCNAALEDPEPRVRLAVGDCLGLLAAQQGTAVWDACRDAILGSIERSWVGNKLPSQR